MKLAFLKNIRNCRALHPLSVYKYPHLPAWLLLHKTPAEESRPEEQLRARYKSAEQRLQEEERPPDVGQVQEFKDSGAARLRRLTSESLWSLAESLHRQRRLFSITGSRHRAPALLPAVLSWWREDKLEGSRGDDAARQWGQREGDKLEALLRIQP